MSRQAVGGLVSSLIKDICGVGVRLGEDLLRTLPKPNRGELVGAVTSALVKPVALSLDERPDALVFHGVHPTTAAELCVVVMPAAGGSLRVQKISGSLSTPTHKLNRIGSGRDRHIATEWSDRLGVANSENLTISPVAVYKPTGVGAPTPVLVEREVMATIAAGLASEPELHRINVLGAVQQALISPRTKWYPEPRSAWETEKIIRSKREWVASFPMGDFGLPGHQLDVFVELYLRRNECFLRSAALCEGDGMPTFTEFHGFKVRMVDIDSWRYHLSKHPHIGINTEAIRNTLSHPAVIKFFDQNAARNGAMDIILLSGQANLRLTEKRRVLDGLIIRLRYERGLPVIKTVYAPDEPAPGPGQRFLDIFKGSGVWYSTQNS